MSSAGVPAARARDFCAVVMTLAAAAFIGSGVRSATTRR